MINCPACAGPDNNECATCNGESFITQEVANTFMIEYNKQQEIFILKNKISEAFFKVDSVEEAKTKIIEIIEVGV